MSPLFNVSLWSSEPTDQEISEALLSTRKIARWVHRSQNVVLWDLPIEGGDQACKTFRANHRVDIEFLHSHLSLLNWSLTNSSTMLMLDALADVQTSSTRIQIPRLSHPSEEGWDLQMNFVSEVGSRVAIAAHAGRIANGLWRLVPVTGRSQGYFPEPYCPLNSGWVDIAEAASRTGFRYGAGTGGRTPMSRSPADFESAASASSAIPALGRNLKRNQA